MRKLPPDTEVYALKRHGLTTKEIADRYGVLCPSVTRVLRRFAHEHKEANVLIGRDVRFATRIENYRTQPTTLDDCRDLLREWGAP